MHKPSSIFSVEKRLIEPNRKPPITGGVYAYWWIGDKSKLLESNTSIKLKGPSGKAVEIEFEDWWPEELSYPCLYVGKSTNLRQRFGWHIKNGSPQRLHKIPASNLKQRAVTTTCQLRYGIEHIFKDHESPLELIHKNVGFSYKTNFKGNEVVERFFHEDFLIGHWRPWFNLDSER